MSIPLPLAITDSSARAEVLFADALALPPLKRVPFLEDACGTDVPLRAEIEALLCAHEDAGGFLDDEASAARPHAEVSGERIAGYRLVEPIGSGGFGVVWLAEQERPVRRRVALKVIKLGMDTREVIARFEQERQALAMMDHPGIAKVFDAGATPLGRPFFVMELVHGAPITAFCDERDVPTIGRLQLFIAVCQAVQHAHQKGVIHRDLKPSNILIAEHDGALVPKVIDFGVAKATEPARLAENSMHTRAEQMIGTPLYMSPEQAEMSGLDVDTRSDIYSLGVLLYELLTGRTPFDPAHLKTQGLDEIRRTIRECEAQKPSTFISTLTADARANLAQRRRADGARLIGQIRGDLDWIVMKAIEKDRARRYQTADSLARDIERHLRSEPVQARPASGLYRFRRMLRRNRLAFAAGAAIAVTLLTGSIVSTWQAIRAGREAARANATLDELRTSTPAFAEQARTLIGQERFAEAAEKLDYAIKLQPGTPEFLLAKGDLLQCQLRFAEAAAIYQAVLRLKPDDRRATTNAALSQTLAAEPKLSHRRLEELLTWMARERRPRAEMIPAGRVVLAHWREHLDALSLPADAHLDRRLTLRDDGLLALDLMQTPVTDLRALQGMPLGSLSLYNAPKFTDLEPLRGLPLRSLVLSWTKVADLQPLRGMTTLQSLALDSTRVTDLAPLRGLRLTSLDLGDARVADLSALRGMPLQFLHMRNTQVTDLAPLAGMPLRDFDAIGIPASDFSPLAGAPLAILILHDSRVGDLSFLRGFPVKKLFLNGCRDARNFAALANLNALEFLRLPEGLPEEELAGLEGLWALPGLRQIEIGQEIHAVRGSSYAEFRRQLGRKRPVPTDDAAR